ncbi:MAG: HAMP domain-containing histidine kinase [Burkholderiales bacterium]|nr:HAMP domain-containing histidine kinase [Burkholderiales bacterium]
MKTASTLPAPTAPPGALRLLAHELRTPLGAILGLAQLIRIDPRTRLDERARHWLEQIERTGHHMLELVGTLAGSVMPQAEGAAVTPLQPVLAEVLARAEGLAAGRGLTLRLARAPSSNCVVRAPALWLNQVLDNLLSNAIKYSPAGDTVTLDTRCAASTPCVQIRVIDQGAGMSEAQRQKLFTPYERLGQEHGAVPGTGLGLYIARQLLDAMGGAIAVSSTPGWGTVVCVDLPLAAACKTGAVDDAPEPVAG